MTAAVRTLRRWIPGLDVALGYKRAWLWPDIRSGLVLTALLVPAGMGYAEAAGLPAYTGLYATIIPLLAYAVFGPSRILVIGPDSSLAPIIAAAILPLALGSEERSVALAGLLAIMVGTILVLAGGLRLGFVTDLLSKPIRIGYLNGIALVVIISQLPKLLGFSIDSLGPVRDVASIAEGITGGEIDVPAALLGVGSIAVILVFRYVWGGRIPGVFVAVAGAMMVTAVFGLDRIVPVVGAMPQGLPTPALGEIKWADVAALAAPAVGVALIAFADTGVLSRTLAARRGEKVSGSREMAGLGIANIAGGLFGGFPISASTSRTPVAEAAGARSQLAGVVGALLVLAFMVLIPGVTRFLPESVLAAVVIMAVIGLIDFSGLIRLWKVDRWDAVLSLASSLGVLLVGVLAGILVSIGLSFIAFVVDSWRPYRTELGRIAEVRGYHDRVRNPEAERIPGVLILRWDARLFFANGGIFDDWVRSMVEKAAKDAEPGAPAIHTVILAAEPITDIDTTAMDELVELDEYLTQRGIRLVLAEVKGPVRDIMRKHGLGTRFPPDRFPPTVGAAVDAETGSLRSDIGDVGEPADDENAEGPRDPQPPAGS
ncbi:MULTISPECIES: SulP family inorganic anion transporter [unclassified Salinibacterium]|uniref:SulP family inorganic anion transporter n=1 Tax=unclassified Salinibacterium TaxID=2632331 RepID=UPI001CD19FA4|nr:MULTISPECIES: SulP family inorganic anion transporter [unclassified Salinibacterium]